MNQLLSLPNIQQRHAPLIAAKLCSVIDRRRTMALVTPVPKPSNLSAMPTPREFGARGSGADDRVALQAWLDHAGPLSLDGDYAHTGSLLPSSGTLVNGWGIGSLTRLDPSVPRIINKNVVAQGSTAWVDKSIRFTGVRFKDNSALPGIGIENVVYIGVDGWEFDHCVWDGSQQFMFDCSNCNNGRFHHNEFTWGGVRVPYTGPAGGWFGGCAFFMLTPCYNTWVHDNWAHDLNGIGFFFDGNSTGLHVARNIVNNCAEAGYVGGPIDSIVEGNIATNVSRIDVSGHGFEWQVGGILRGNFVRGCDGANIYISDPQDGEISGGHLADANQVYDGTTGAIIIRTYDPDLTKGTNGLTISGVTMSARNGKGAHAISCVNYSPNAAQRMRNVALLCNTTGDAAQWKTGALGLPTGVWGNGCSANGNPGIKDIPLLIAA